jgi:4-hydroxy-2-oxoheptanedioate aldolase
LYKVKNLTGIFLGPLDLSISLGFDPKQEPDTPEVIEAMNHVLRTCQSQGKKAALFCGTGSGAAAAADVGWDLVFPGADISMLSGAAKQTLQAANQTSVLPLLP